MSTPRFKISTCFQVPAFLTLLAIAFGESPVKNDGGKTIASEEQSPIKEFLSCVSLWEKIRVGKEEPGKLYQQPFRKLILKAGKSGNREATPALLHLLNNVRYPENYMKEYSIKALGNLRDERAIVSLLGEFRWYYGPSSTGGALKALLEYERPMSPQLLLALKGTNSLRKRRALWGVRLLAQDRVNKLLKVKLSEKEKPWFEVSEAVRDAVEECLSDPDPTIRFDALRTYQLLNPDGLKHVARRLKAEDNTSIKFLLANPDLAPAEPNNVMYRLAIERKGTPKSVQKPQLKIVSEWVRLGPDRSIRVSCMKTDLVLSEPVYLMNPPAWMKFEIRNDTGKSIQVNTEPATNVPLVNLFLRDGYGRHVVLNPGIYEECIWRIDSVTVQPGKSISWSWDLMEFEFIFDGKYGLYASREAKSSKLLDLTVRGLPRRLWTSRNPPFGFNPRQIYYERHEIPSGPEIYNRAEPIQWPPAVLYSDEPEVKIDKDGNRHTFYAKRDLTNTRRKALYEKPVRLSALKHVSSYYELVKNKQGNWIKWTRFKKGLPFESITYDSQGRIEVHTRYDRHGKPHSSSTPGQFIGPGR